MKVISGANKPNRPWPKHSRATAYRSAALVAGIMLAMPLLGPALADSRISYESPIKGTELRGSVEDALKKIDPDGYAAEDETLGFSFRLSNRWKSPFTYDLFGGTISATIPQSILRIEGDTGDARTIARVLSIEKVITDNTAHAEGDQPRLLTAKSQAAAQSLNLVAPWLSILYMSYDSPRLSRGQTWFRAVAFFMLDAFIIYASGTDLFQHSYGKTCPDITKLNGTCDIRTHPTAMAAGLVLTRLVGAWQGFNLVRGHNRLVELKYTFYLDY